MWLYEHSIETTAPAEAVWALYRDVDNWGSWDTSVESIMIHGPFAVGTEISMVPTGQDEVRFTIIELRENELFADETIFGEVRLRFIHRLERLESGTLVTHRVEVDGPDAEHIGPAVTEDLPEAMAGLVKLAAS